MEFWMCTKNKTKITNTLLPLNLMPWHVGKGSHRCWKFNGTDSQKQSLKNEITQETLLSSLRSLTRPRPFKAHIQRTSTTMRSLYKNNLYLYILFFYVFIQYFSLIKKCIALHFFRASGTDWWHFNSFEWGKLIWYYNNLLTHFSPSFPFSKGAVLYFGFFLNFNPVHVNGGCDGILTLRLSAFFSISALFIFFAFLPVTLWPIQASPGIVFLHFDECLFLFFSLAPIAIRSRVGGQAEGNSEQQHPTR